MSGLSKRARAVLARPGTWIEARGDLYAVRRGTDRRARPILSLDEAAFRDLVARPGLKRRDGGGWTLIVPRPATETPPPPGRPGMVEGERVVMEADGRARRVRANLGHSPIQWLARRRDTDGRPYLAPAEVAAGERLRQDAEIALSGPSLTMRWDALPRSGGGSAARVEPGDRALNAADRVRRALAACPADTRAFLDQICVRGATLQLAEQACGLRRRSGRDTLRRGLAALARDYGVG